MKYNGVMIFWTLGFLGLTQGDTEYRDYTPTGDVQVYDGEEDFTKVPFRTLTMRGRFDGGALPYITTHFTFFSDGRYQVNAVFEDGYPAGGLSAFIYLDYDFARVANSDCMEFVDRYPEVTPYTMRGYDILTAHADERSQQYSNLSGSVHTLYPKDIYCRFFPDRSLHEMNKVFSVLWAPDRLYPGGGTFYGSRATIHNRLFTGLDELSLLAPTNPANTVQTIGEYDDRPSYAYEGTDQEIVVELYDFLLDPGEHILFAVEGKIFQRTGSRPVRTRIVEMSGQSRFDDVFDIEAHKNDEIGGKYTFEEAMVNLCGAWSMGMKVDAEYPSSQMGEEYECTLAELHNLMLSARQVIGGMPVLYDIGRMQREYAHNFGTYNTNLLVTNWSYGGAEGLLFDAKQPSGGTGDLDLIPRSGCAVFWPAIREAGAVDGVHPDHMDLYGMLVSLHELGHLFNLEHNWANLGGDIMTYTKYNDNDIEWGARCTDFVRTAPEAWVKPGKFGAPSVLPPYLSPSVPYPTWETR